MPLRLEIRKMLSSRSDRVKSVDLHPTEPWVLTALYNGNVFIWDYEQATMVKSYEVCSLPVRCAKFIVRKQWFIAASDDMMLRVYNYNTMEKVNAWEAHTDYIRFVEVHPNLPYVLSCSDDMSIKLWDWERGWDCCQVFEGHVHYVMMIKVNPRDTNTFASASLDRSIKVWGVSASAPHFTLDGHDRGVNCLDYYPGGDRPYLVSGADDKTVRIWDYQTKTCVQTLVGHHNNVSAALFHPRLPVIVSASEDGTVRLWHSTTYRAETTLNYSMERAWALAVSADSNKVAVGYDEGTVVLKLGHETPVASLDPHTGRVVWAQNNDIQTASLKGVAAEAGAQDGERLPVAPKDLGATEIFPQALRHNCNGRFLVVCGDGEYVVYTSQALRNKAFGTALDFAWSAVGTGDYAVRESISRVRTYRNFKEAHTLRPPLAAAEGLFGGAALGVRGADAVVFFDWDEGIMVRKIDVAPRDVFWSDAGDLVLLACEESYYVLRYDAGAVAAALARGAVDAEEGVEAAFELVGEVAGRVRTGQWVGACFLYTSDAGRLSYYVGGEVMTLCHLDHPMYMLGYLPKEDRVYLMDKAKGIYSYKVLQSYLQYQTAVVRKDFEAANALLPSIPASEYTAVARFLESQGFKEEALAVSRDPDHRFDLACELGKLALARELLDAIPPAEYDTLDSQTKWKRLGDLALSECDMALVEKCAANSGDLGGLLLLHSSTGNAAGLAALAADAAKAGKTNVGFLALFLLGRLEECLELLVKAGRLPEAAFMARTYLPSEMPRLVELWKKDLQSVSVKAAEALADPSQYPNLFEDLDVALRVEQMFKAQRGRPIPAAQWPQAKDQLDMDLIALVKAGGGGAAAAPGPPPPQQLNGAAAAAPPQPPTAAAAAPSQPEHDDDGVDVAAALAEEEAAATAAAAVRAQAERQEAEQQQAAARAAAAAAAEERARRAVAEEAAARRAQQEAAARQAASAAAAAPPASPAAQVASAVPSPAARTASATASPQTPAEVAQRLKDEAMARARAAAMARVEAAKRAAEEAAAASRAAEQQQAAATMPPRPAPLSASPQPGNGIAAAAPPPAAQEEDEDFGENW
ncbi:coatomer WD associated region-domain-containing protein [Tribonema minus]|uniref:Beta'-coat protein n=1 Tax=Tribonema minus TaxID=303371 RepID=A0A835YRX4_9STRA|nr:coatomer WD associated region-domain-containing protein [Tribonema minus]